MSHKLSDTGLSGKRRLKQSDGLSCRQFLEGSKIPFKAWTDHKNLEALRAQYFNQLNFTLQYLLGTWILQRSHNARAAGHFGFVKTLYLVKRQF